MTLEHVYLVAVACLAVALSINTYRVWKLRKHLDHVARLQEMMGLYLMTKDSQAQKEKTHV